MQRISNLGQAVGLEPQEHDIGIGDRANVVGGARMDQELVIGTEDPDTVVPYRLQMGAAGDQGDLAAAAGEAGAHVPADRPGADHGQPHGWSRSWAASRMRCGLPVAVRGISPTT